MLNCSLGRGRKDEAARALYLAVVAQARRPEFYLRGAVPDTLDGRLTCWRCIYSWCCTACAPKASAARLSRKVCSI